MTFAETTTTTGPKLDASPPTHAPSTHDPKPNAETSAPDPAAARQATKPTALTPLLDTIRTLGRLLDDLEHVRIMNSNRIAALERTHGEALPHLHATHNMLHHVEHQAELELVRAWRKHPLAPWAKQQRGVGEKSIARLIAEIGDPYLATTLRAEPRRLTPDTSPATPLTKPTPLTPGAPPDEARLVTEPTECTPRLISQLWQYSGVGKPGRIPKNATQAELLAHGKPRAKKQLYLIATGMLKAGNRGVYDSRRETTKHRVHADRCPQCKAKPGDPWRDGHKHADALRIVAKEFLRDLYVEAERLA